MDPVNYIPIGVIHSPFREPKGTPIQPIAGKDIDGTVEVYREYSKGLKDLNGFSHVILVYHFHLSNESLLEVIPFMDDQKRGVFATRAPKRPNPIGISVVQLVSIEGNRLHVRDLDIVNGSPLLDIKPYIPAFDTRDTRKIGWLEKNINRLPTSRDDGRFIR